jgi:hypothetical protein
MPPGCRSWVRDVTWWSLTTPFMDVADLPTTVSEAARILEPGGRMCVCVTHPLRYGRDQAGADGPRGASRAAPWASSRSRVRRISAMRQRSSSAFTKRSW